MSFFGHRKKRILVVEDEIDIAEGLKARLELDDYEVILAGDGAAGVEMARKERPDAIILDVMMPKINGYDVCKIIKDDVKLRSIPVLVLTALPQLKDAELAFEAGATDFLNKPYTNERLIQKVSKLFAKKS